MSCYLNRIVLANLCLINCSAQAQPYEFCHWLHPPYHKPMAGQPQVEYLPDCFQNYDRMRSPIQGGSCFLICKDKLPKFVTIKLSCMHAQHQSMSSRDQNPWQSSRAPQNLTIRSHNLITKCATDPCVAPMTLHRPTALCLSLQSVLATLSEVAFSYLEAYVPGYHIKVHHWKTSPSKLI